MTKTYFIILRPAEHGYRVLIPDFNTSTYGSSIDQSIIFATELVSLKIRTLLEAGAAIPQPRNAKDILEITDRAHRLDVLSHVTVTFR